MLHILYSILVCSFFYSCNIAPVDKTNRKVVSKSEIGKDTVKNSNFISGYYQDVSLAVDSNNIITGVYEYYDNWDNIHKEYVNINVFYFFGKINNDSIVNIVGSWPNSPQKLNGRIYTNTNAGSKFIKIYLDREPLGYNDVSFTNKAGVTMNLDKKKNWAEIRIIKSAKARLFNEADSLTLRKGYLVRNDIVKVLYEASDGWEKVEYNPKNDKNKYSILWIRAEDLFDIDPSKW